jgi:hypothetical protein
LQGGWRVVFKKKLKLIKGSLNVWHVSNIEGRLRDVKERLLFLDNKG